MYVSPAVVDEIVAHPEKLRLGGERREVTVMFSDLCSSTLLGHGRDPEVLAAVLHEVKAAAARVVAKHDGVVNQFYGDGVMAIFGFPTPREDDVRRAAEAAPHPEAQASNEGA